MNKLILNPRKDTVTICIPPDWVGRPVVCILEKYEYENSVSAIPEAQDVMFSYNAQVRRQTQKRRHYHLRRHNRRK